MKSALVPALLIAAILPGCQTIDEASRETMAHATLRLANGSPAGTARLLASGNQMTISVTLIGIGQGTHRLHLSATGSCETADLTSPGSQINLSDYERGPENPQAPHLGNVPNTLVDGSGTGSVSATLAGETEEVLSQVFDEDGTAIIVHATADDDPIDTASNSSSRIACGEFTRN